MTKIVMIEDDPTIRSEVRDWLQFEGYAVIEAADGRIGLKKIEMERPDLVLCDIAMPEMDGYEVLLEVRANTTLSHIPFVFLTAAVDRNSMRKGMDLGADDYLTKPFTHGELLNAVYSRLQKKAAQDKQIQEEIDILNHAFSQEREKRLFKSRLVAMFSHDFRNPLASILMSSGILRNHESRLSPESKQRRFDFIDGAVHKLLQMLDDMLTVAEIENGRLEFAPQPTVLPTFVETLVDEFRLIDHGAHEWVFHSTFQGQVEVDQKLLRQIIANLLSNAIKYSPPETTITVTLSEDGNNICLEIQDQGIGIPENSLQHLFEPFHRAANVKNVKGTGLGLAIVKECVEQHQGRIEVKSEETIGTTFTVELPLRKV